MTNQWVRAWLVPVTAMLSQIVFVSGCKDEKATTPSAVPTISAPPLVPSAVPSAVASATSALGESSCGELGCRLFDTPQEAFAAILADKPLVLAIGESHAPKGAEEITSSTKRFTETFLPMLVDPKRERIASDIVLEIWVAEGQCG